MHFSIAFPVATLVFLACATNAQPPCFESNLGTNLQLSDDSVAQGRALGFAFPFAGRSVSAIDVSSNGFVWLGSNSGNGCCNGEVPGFLASTARVAIAWTDLNPSAGGSVHFTTFPGRAVITWNGVPEFGYSEGLTAQMQLLSDGSIFLMWGSPFAIVGHDTLVGVTPGGGGGPNPRAIDFSAALPFNSGTAPTVYELLTTGNFDLGGRVLQFVPNGQGGYNITQRTDCRFSGFAVVGVGCPASLPVTLFAAQGSRPALGTNFDMVVGEAPNGSLAGAMLYGAATSTPLDPIGMIGCTLYSSGAVVVPFVVLGRFSTARLVIPNQQSLIGAALMGQAAIVAPGANPAGVVASNGGSIVIGA